MTADDLAAACGMLSAAAGVLLPGNDVWPAAGALTLGATMAETASRHPTSRTGLAMFVALAPTALDDPSAGAAEHTDALRTLEVASPTAFNAVRAAAYEAYYTHPKVQAVLVERCGFRSGPAQPQGYRQFLELDALPDLSGVRARGLTWRDDGTPTAALVRATQESNQCKEWNEEEVWLWQQ